MAKIKIPESEYDTLTRLTLLEATAFDALIRAIESEDSTSLQMGLFDKLAGKVPSIKSSEIKSFLKTSTALFNIKENLKKTSAQMAEGLVETIQDEKPDGFPLEQISILQDRINKLLDAGKVVELTAKAYSVMMEQGRACCSVRILSDIRPVFGTPPDSVSAAMIIHHLAIDYYQDGDYKQFFVAMNNDDICKLKEAVERAETKTETLASFIRKTGTPLFEGENN